MNMTSFVSVITFFFFLFFFLSHHHLYCEAQQQPKKVSALYVFGDSLVDVGNNNYLKISIVKANHFPYGIDFPSKKPTGRFSNGKNAADFIAEELGLGTTSPPYLSLLSEAKNTKNNQNVSISGGASFASAGAGIFDDRFRQSIPLTKQVDYYVEAHNQMEMQMGKSALQSHLSNSIFALVIGSNDLFGYFDSSDLRHKSTPRQYVDSMIFSLKAQLQRIYENGGRKFAIAGVGALGCCPDYRLKNKTECEADINQWATQYNEGLKSMLKEWKSHNKDLISYSFFDTYAANYDLILNPSAHGFSEIKAACCGLGELKARVPCLPLTSFCSNRNDHIFWDQFHPTEAASRIFVDKIFNGPSQYTSPVTMKQLLAL